MKRFALCLSMVLATAVSSERILKPNVDYLVQNADPGHRENMYMMFKTKAFALRKVRLSTQPHGAWNVRYVGDSDVFTLQYVNQFDGQRKKGNWQLLAKKWGRKRCYLNPRKGTEFQAIRHGDYIQLANANISAPKPASTATTCPLVAWEKV